MKVQTIKEVRNRGRKGSRKFENIYRQMNRQLETQTSIKVGEEEDKEAESLEILNDR